MFYKKITLFDLKNVKVLEMSGAEKNLFLTGILINMVPRFVHLYSQELFLTLWWTVWSNVIRGGRKSVFLIQFEATLF